MQPTGQQLHVFTNVDDRRTHTVALFYSSLYCAFTFILLHYSGHLLSCIHAHYLGFEPTVNYEGLSSLRHTTGWGPRSIAFVYLAPAALGFGVFTIASFLCFWLSPFRTHLRNIMFWSAFNAYLLFYSYFFFGMIGIEYRLGKFYASYAAVFDWLYWSPETTKVVLGFFALVGLLGAFVFSPLILTFNHSQSLVGLKGGEKVVFVNVVLIPFLIGMVIVGAATFPMSVEFHAVRISSVVPLFLTSWVGMKLITGGSIDIVKGGLEKRPFWYSIVLAILLMVITRFVLSIRIM